jgi:hypothetical protein
MVSSYKVLPNMGTIRNPAMLAMPGENSGKARDYYLTNGCDITDSLLCTQS